MELKKYLHTQKKRKSGKKRRCGSCEGQEKKKRPLLAGEKKRELHGRGGKRSKSLD